MLKDNFLTSNHKEEDNFLASSHKEDNFLASNHKEDDFLASSHKEEDSFLAFNFIAKVEVRLRFKLHFIANCLVLLI